MTLHDEWDEPFHPTVRSRIPRTSDGRPHPLARVSRQLERFPTTTARAGDDRRELTLAFDVGGEAALWQIRTPGALPGPLGNDLYLAACRAWDARAMAHEDLMRDENREVFIVYPDLLELTGHDRGGAQYDAIRSTLVLLKEVVVTAENTWREDGRYIREEVNFSVFDECGSRLHDDTGELVVYFRFSQRLAKALVSDYRLLDMRVHNALAGDVARRLYRVVDAERFVADRTGARELTLSLDQVRARLGLRAKKPAVLKRILDPAHAELVQVGFLAPLPESDRYPEVSTGRRYPTVQVRYVIALAYWEEHRNRPRDARSVPEVVPELLPERALAPALAPAPARDALREILGVSAESAGVSDLAWWVREIERSLGDTQSSGFYKQMVEAFAAARAMDALEFVLRGVARDGAGLSPKALGAAFTSRLKVRARELGIPLPGAGATPGGPATRRGGMAAIGALLPLADASDGASGPTS